MKVTDKGRALIEQREGVKLKAYVDSVGVLTIGVGHTSAAGPPHVVPGLVITQEQCDQILSQDLSKFETAVDAAIKVPMADHENDAFVSLAFNIGAGAFGGSTVARKFNAGDKKGAADAFLMWNKGTVKGKKVVIAGLTTRRQSERKQFLTAYN